MYFIKLKSQTIMLVSNLFITIGFICAGTVLAGGSSQMKEEPSLQGCSPVQDDFLGCCDMNPNDPACCVPGMPSFPYCCVEFNTQECEQYLEPPLDPPTSTVTQIITVTSTTTDFFQQLHQHKRQLKHRQQQTSLPLLTI